MTEHATKTHRDRPAHNERFRQAGSIAQGRARTAAAHHRDAMLANNDIRASLAERIAAAKARAVALENPQPADLPPPPQKRKPGRPRKSDTPPVPPQTRQESHIQALSTAQDTEDGATIPDEKETESRLSAPARKGRTLKLPAAAQRALAVILDPSAADLTLIEQAERAGLPERTYSRWKSHPLVRAALADAMLEAIGLALPGVIRSAIASASIPGREGFGDRKLLLNLAGFRERLQHEHEHHHAHDVTGRLQTALARAEAAAQAIDVEFSETPSLPATTRESGTGTGEI